MPERRRRAALGLLVAVLLGLALAGPALAVVGDAPARQSGEDLQLPVDPGRDPERTRERADEILRGDEYQSPDARDRSVVDRVREWIGDRLPDLDGPTAGAGLDIFAYVVFGVVVLGGLAAIAFVVARTRGTRRPPDEPTDADVDVSPLRTPDEWDAEAERCEQAGDHRGAVRARFRALTTTLAHRDLVADTPGRTTGELRTDVAERAPALTPAFGAVADLFERVWFGGATAGPEQSAAARDLARTALASAPRRATVGPHDDEDGR
ncbi:MAG TPA: DUF4129 domain-containing protein [Iamia sp.]